MQNEIPLDMSHDYAAEGIKPLRIPLLPQPPLDTPTPPDSQTGNESMALRALSKNSFHPPQRQMLTPIRDVDPNTGRSSVTSHFLLDLDQRFPRVPVTPSMLYTYAHMRGLNTIRDDPLHGSLYIHPNRVLSTRRLHLVLVSRRNSIAELPKFSTLFWDPIDSAPQPQWPPLLLVAAEDPAEKTSYAEHVERVKPAIGKNHYKGDMVNANFGYIKIGDTWCDPDSELELSRAVHIHEYAHICEDGARVKPLQPPALDSGPRIMSPEEEDEFYKGFVEEVTDEQDGEGDPRQYRISPAVFARWAAGAVAGEQYQEEPWWPPSKLPSPDPHYEDQIVPKPHSELQFDVETGSLLSGIYENDPEPRVLRNAQGDELPPSPAIFRLTPSTGVNITRPPSYFSYSYPQASLHLDRAAFSPPYQPYISSAISTAVSTPSVFNSETGIRNLASNDPLAGEQLYDAAKHAIELHRARSERHSAHLSATADAARKTAEARILLAREVFFLNSRVAQLPPPTAPSRRKLSTDSGSPSPPDAARSSAKIPKRKKQYERYIAEELERQAISARKMEQYQKRLEDEHQEILEEIEGLKILKDRMLATLGVGAIEQLPGLIPRREPSGRDLRTQFGLEGTESGAVK
ncbi:hypothetical protein JHW43_002783 [Diplocarpon mali]|nr:hypothetical protein JHW43_002783 [Diplocarpon mali]